MSFKDQAKQKADELKEKVPDSVKEGAGTVKEKASGLADKVGEKVPDSVREKLDGLKAKLKRGAGGTGETDGGGEADGVGATAAGGQSTPSDLVETATEPATGRATDAVGDASAAGVGDEPPTAPV
jgi:hypothetical protein